MSGSSGGSGDRYAHLSDEEWDNLSNEQLVIALLTCFKSGKELLVEKAWGRLYNRHATGILRYLYYLLSHSQLQGVADIAEELLDTTFVNAFVDLVKRKEPEHFTGSDASFKAWIKTIAHREFLKYVQKPKQDVSLEALIEKGNEGQAVLSARQVSAHPSDNIERHLAIEEAVSKLPPREAQVFRLVFYEQMSVKQIAQHLNLPDKTVQMAFYRGRKRFKEIYAGPLPATSKWRNAKRGGSSKPRNPQRQTDKPE